MKNDKEHCTFTTRKAVLRQNLCCTRIYSMVDWILHFWQTASRGERKNLNLESRKGQREIISLSFLKAAIAFHRY